MKLIATTLLLLFYQFVSAQQCSVDSSFDYEGWCSHDFVGNKDIVTELIPLSDNKLIAVGYAGNDLVYNVGMIKYNYDGSLDLTFGIDGKLMDAPENVSLIPFDAVLQNDTQIIVGGSWFEDGQNDLFLARYNISGVRDNSFGDDGYVQIDLGDSNELIASLAMQEDGKIIAAGRDFNGITFICFVARFNANGTIDSTFGIDGYRHFAITDNGDFVRNILVQPDGKIAGCGYGLNLTSGYNFIGFRMTQDGQLDDTFNGNGKFEFDFELKIDIASAIAIQEDGKLLFGGTTDAQTGIIRILENGLIDSTFGNNGEFILERIYCNALLIDNNQQILASGISVDDEGNDDFGIFRITSSGSIDTTFGDSVVIVTNLGNIFEGSSCLKFLNDGKIISGGYSGIIDPNFNFSVVRYNYEEKVGIDELLINKQQIIIYPNPAESSFNCILTGILRNGNYSYCLNNTFGQIIDLGNIFVDENQSFTLTFPQNTASGIYYLSVNGQDVTLNTVIQKL